MSKPREFWIGFPDAVAPLISTDKQSVIDYAPESQRVHVIEKRAYDEVQAEIERLQSRRNHEFCDAERDRYREALTKIMNLGDTVYAEEIARKALG